MQLRMVQQTCEHEIEANSFAANLLMPKQFIRRDIAHLTRFNGEIVLRDEDIQSLAKRYQVSVMAIRTVMDCQALLSELRYSQPCRPRQLQRCCRA
jgi:Zn-dependent peptidase ImmA (M78 family)